jgi:hypothetical protein
MGEQGLPGHHEDIPGEVTWFTSYPPGCICKLSARGNGPWRIKERHPLCPLNAREGKEDRHA